jgi:hypothetical protein
MIVGVMVTLLMCKGEMKLSVRGTHMMAALDPILALCVRFVSELVERMVRRRKTMETLWTEQALMLATMSGMARS